MFTVPALLPPGRPSMDSPLPRDPPHSPLYHHSPPPHRSSETRTRDQRQTPPHHKTYQQRQIKTS